MDQSTKRKTSPPPLRAVREARGKSLRSVARASGVDPARISKIERGLVVPTVRELLRLGRVLGLPELLTLLGPYDRETS